MNNQNLVATSLKIIVLFFIVQSAYAQQPNDSLDLTTALSLAMESNHLIRISNLKTEESAEKVKEARSKYFPIIMADGLYVYSDRSNQLNIPLGPLGTFPIPLPTLDNLDLNNNIYSANIFAYQPITELFKVSNGLKIAKNETNTASAETLKAQLKIQQSVEQLYFGLLIAQREEEEAKINLQLSETKLYDIESAILAGKSNIVNRYAFKADILRQKQILLQTKNKMSNYQEKLIQITGLKSSYIQLKEEKFKTEPLRPLEYYTEKSKISNPELIIAQNNILKTDQAVAAAQNDYLPSVGIFAGYSYLNLYSGYETNGFTGGARLSWNVFDFGNKKSILRQRKAQNQQAIEYQTNLAENNSIDIRKAYSDITEALELVQLSEEVLVFRKEENRLIKNGFETGLKLKQEMLESEASLLKAKVDLLSAQSNYRLLLTKLNLLTGTLNTN